MLPKFEKALDWGVSDWKQFLLDPENSWANPRDGLTNFAIFIGYWLATPMTESKRVLAYSNAVQATLEVWTELDSMTRKEWDEEPIDFVAKMAYQRSSDGSTGAVYPILQAHYNRLWLESPRPHGTTLRRIAFNSNGAIPVSHLDLWFLFKLPDWALTAMYVAVHKGFNNLAIEFMDKIIKAEVLVSASNISWLVHVGFPKEKGLRWLCELNEDSKYARRIAARWASELESA